MIPSIAPIIFSGLVDQLRALPALAGVQVTSVPLAKNTQRESIQLFGTQPADEEWSALGNKLRDEIFEIVGGVYVLKAIPNTGSDVQEVVGRAVRDRAYELAGVISTYLRGDSHMTAMASPTAVEGVIEFASADLTQGVNTDGRWCELDVRIRVRARLRIS